MGVILETRLLERTFTQGIHIVAALKAVSISFEKGEFVVITGPSGGGKSTLLHILGLLDTQYRGEVWIENQPSHTFTPRQLAAWRLQKIGFVFQDIHLLKAHTALDNVALPCYRLNGKLRQARNHARSLLREFYMEDRIRHKPNRLSGGEAQRVAIARALVNNPSIVLADEPTAHLDQETTQLVLDRLERLSKTGKLILAVSHDEALLQRAHRRIELRYGQTQE